MKIKAVNFLGVRSIFVSLLSFLMLSLFCISLHAQTATTGQVVGRVTDASGAAVPAAHVTLVEPSTDTRMAAVTNSTGHYAFPVVSPGQYVLTVDKAGFRTSTVSDISIQVMKSNTVNVQLQVGAVAQTVTVTATSGAELQTTNATVGNELSTKALENLPQLSRDATALMFLQPGVAPPTHSTSTGGQIAGALAEQVTYSLDGGDGTSDLEGTSSYQNSSTPQLSIGPASSASVIPNPISTTQEFRVVTAGANGTFTRSGGGEVTVLTKRGTNQFHGELYEYHDDDALNANTWRFDALGLSKPHGVDNRFGANIGGPFSALFGPAGKPLKNRAWFFFGWEEHRFHDSSSITRVVPTASLKSGLITLGGTTVDLAPGHISSNCGPNGTSLCDPRNKGMSPVVAKQLALYHTGNDSSVGDGVNTTGYTFSLPTPLRQDIGVVRTDFRINPKWGFFTTYHLSKTTRASTSQLDIVSNPPSTPASTPIEPSMITFEVTGQLTPSFTSVFHGSYTRNWWSYARAVPTPLVSGTSQAFEFGGENRGTGGDWNNNGKMIADPININAQYARRRVWNGHDWYAAGDFSWVQGHHLFQFGASGYIDTMLLATDLPYGSLTGGPLLQLEAKGNRHSEAPGEFLSIPTADEPPALAGDLRYNELYAGILGLVDRAVQTGVRNSALQGMPYGALASATPTEPAIYTYFQDTWQMTPDVTGVLGLTWSAALPYHEKQGKIPIVVDVATLQPVNVRAWISAREASLERQGVSIVNGQVNALNPAFGLTPTNFIPKGGQLQRGNGMVGTLRDFGPRLSVAWNLPYHNRIFGNNKETVIRAGYSIVYDRVTGSSAVFPSVLGGAFADTFTCGGPLSNGACSGSGTDPSNAFRIGVDGSSLPIPAVAPLQIPYVPSGTQAAPYGSERITQVDPWFTPGWANEVTASLQRALPGHMLLDIGYIGRFARNLQVMVNLSSPDYKMKDAKSGQTFAQAFDGVAQALRNGTGVPNEPFFNNLIGLSTCQNAGYANCSLMVANEDPADLINGSLGSFAGTFDFLTPGSIDPLQFVRLDTRTNFGRSNYNAGFISLQKTGSGGGPFGPLSFQFNWTYSHATGIFGHQQQNTTALDTPYNPLVDYFDQEFDRRHVFTAWYSYPLPFGRGQAYSASSAILNRVVGGWTWSGVWTIMSGLPDCVGADGDYGSADGFGTCAIATNGFNLTGAGGSMHTNVAGSSGVGTSGFGLNMFSNPAAVYQNLRRPLLSQDAQISYGSIRTPWNWQWDMEISKNLAATERYKFTFAADLLNALNHPYFTFPSLDLASPKTFGTFSSQYNQPRQIQLSLRVSF